MEAIPVVDLRLLNQAEINALSRASSSSAGEPRRCDDVVIPKIDRSVFNESAGSRKQTYCRLRLAPRKPPDLSPSASPSPSSSSGAARGRRGAGGLLAAAAASSSAAPPPLPLPPPAPLAAVDDSGRQENKQIILFLRQLFAKNSAELANAAVSNDERALVPSASVPTAGVDANPNPAGSALGKRGREQEATWAVNEDREVLNVNDVGVDLVALAEKEDPFGLELKSQTRGLVTEEEFLRFLSGLEGQWGSRRKKRRIVDAGIFGDALPKGWKVLLGLKRKERNIWLHCRRYVSPSGKQFVSCKEVSSYLLSLVGSQEAKQQNAAQNSADKLGNEYAVRHSHQVNIAGKSPSCYSAMPISSIPPDSGKQTILFRVEDPAKAQLLDVPKCQECNLTLADKGAYVQHFLTFHGSSRKRRRLGQSIGDGVIIKDGKYECQFCHKMFTERRRYNGHVGIHVKYCDRSLEPVADEIIMGKKITSSSDGVASTFVEHNTSVDSEKEFKLIEQNISTKSIHEINDSYPHGDEHAGITVSDHTMKCCDTEKEKIMLDEVCTTGAVGETKNSFPVGNSCDNDKERAVMQEICPVPNEETNDSSSQNNMLSENGKNEHIIKCFDNESSSVQEVCNAECTGEINDGFPLCNKQNTVNKIDCFPKFNNETSESGFVESLTIDYGATDQKPRESADTGNAMNGDMHTYLDCTCPSLTDVGNCTSEGSFRNDLSNKIPIDEMERDSKLNIGYESDSISILGGGESYAEIVTSSGSVIGGKENSENKKSLDSNPNILSGTEQSNTRNASAVGMAEELLEMVKSGSEPERDLACANTASDRAVIVESIVHGKVQLSVSGTEGERFLEHSMLPSGRKHCDMDTAIDDMVPSSGEEIMLDIMGQSGNELKDDLISDGTLLGADASRNGTGIGDEGNMQSLPVNMQTSWEQTSAHLPILDMISDQGNFYLHCAGRIREEISFFEDLRLDNIGAQKFVVSANCNSRRQPEELMAGAAMLDSGSGPCILPEWDPTYLNLGPRRRITTVCVWCSREFEQEDVDIEVQPDSVGFMCPTCKAKIPGAI